MAGIVFLLALLGCTLAASVSCTVGVGSCEGCASGTAEGRAGTTTLSDSLPSAGASVSDAPVMQHRRLMQERNLEALAKLRALSSEQLLQTPATATPPGARRSSRRRRLIAKAKTVYASQCLYQPIPPLEEEEEEEGAEEVKEEEVKEEEGLTADGATAGGAAAEGDAAAGAGLGAEAAATVTGAVDPSSGATTARRQAQAATPDAPPSPPSSPPSDMPSSPPAPPPAVPHTGRCYLNPAVVAQVDFAEPESPIENVLVRAGFTSFQCMFEDKKRRCGTYNHPPHDCQWQEDQGRCMVGHDFLIPRVVEYLHCRDDTVLTPFWHRCYMIGVLTGDSDNCGQADGNGARCYWFEARNDEEEDVCGPSAGGGVEDRDQYDALVASMRNGTWEREWFGECPTADLAFTIRSACNYTTDEDCASDPSCRLHPQYPPEYGRCRLADGLLWDAIFGADSELFNSTAAAMVECAAASDSLGACMAAGSLAAEPGGPVDIDDSRFDPDLWFIEDVTPGSAGPGARASAARALLAASLALLMTALLQPAGAATVMEM